MVLSSTLIQFIKHCEGFSSIVYLCAAGCRTIGYGHVLAPNEYWDVITQSEAEALLIADLEKIRLQMLRLLTMPLEPYQADALLSFTFNVGCGALQRSTLRQKINRAEHVQAADEFPRWVWAGGRKLAGLIKRRALEAEMYRGLLY